MGTYTTNYQLLKPGNGIGTDLVDDFVDVESQIDRNLTMIDDFGKRASSYRQFNNAYGTLPTVGNNVGDRIFNQWDSSVALWNGTAWVQTPSKAEVWTDAALNSGYEVLNDGTVYNFSYAVESDTATVRGHIIKTALAIWTNGTVFNVAPSGSLPSPAMQMEFFADGAAAPGSTAQFYKVVVTTTGSMSVIRYGSVAQTAASANNYVQLSGISYGIS